MTQSPHREPAKGRARPTDQALAVPANPASGLDPSGFDPSRIAALQSDKYSPNLRKWVLSRKQRAYRIAVYRNADGQLYIGQRFADDNWFHGSQLNRVLCVGSRAESWAFAPEQLTLALIPDFWDRYERIGRCAIDEEHDRYFVGDETRWQVEGDVRSCRWCGNYKQTLRRWTETVERERWESTQ